MLYAAYDIVRRATRPMYQLLDAGQKLARDEYNPLRNTTAMKTMAGIWELQARALKTYDKPRYLVWEHLGDLEIELEEQRRRRADATARLADYEPRLGESFPLQGELDQKRARRAELEA